MGVSVCVQEVGRVSGALLHYLSPHALDTRSLTEPGALLAASKAGVQACAAGLAVNLGGYRGFKHGSSCLHSKHCFPLSHLQDLLTPCFIEKRGLSGCSGCC